MLMPLLLCSLSVVWRDIPLYAGLNDFSEFAAPKNIDNLGPNFIYVGFSTSLSDENQVRIRWWNWYMIVITVAYQ